MKTKIKYSVDVQSQWDEVWDNDSIERNQSKLDYPEYWALYEKYINHDSRILEAGSGLGKWLNYFHYRGYDITGIDYSRTAISKLSEYDSNLKNEFGDVTSLPFDDNSFDVYLSFGTLEHLERESDLVLAVNEIHRVLRKDGIAYITIPNLNFMNFVFFVKNYFLNSNMLRKLFGKKPRESHFFEYNYTEREFVKYFTNDKFQICEVVPENIPLILKRFKFLRNRSSDIAEFNTNLNGFGQRIWTRLLSKKDRSFSRRQMSHLLIYVIRKI